MTATAPETDSPTDETAAEPRLAKTIQIHNIRGIGFQLIIDGEPLPYLLAGVRVDVGGSYAVAEVAILCERLDLVDEPKPVEEAPAPVEVPAHITALVERIATTHSAITYHPEDPNAAAVAQEARRVGLTCVPSEGVQFRTIAGVHGGR